MKYYLISYPETLSDGFSGSAKGPFIKLIAKSRDDVGLLEHEKTHVRQWYGASAGGVVVGALLSLLVSPAFWGLALGALSIHPLLYQFIRPYRKWSEVQAYRKQLATGGYPSSEFAAKHLATKYDLGLTLDEAKALLK